MKVLWLDVDAERSKTLKSIYPDGDWYGGSVNGEKVDSYDIIMIHVTNTDFKLDPFDTEQFLNVYLGIQTRAKVFPNVSEELSLRYAEKFREFERAKKDNIKKVILYTGGNVEYINSYESTVKSRYKITTVEIMLIPNELTEVESCALQKKIEMSGSDRDEFVRLEGVSEQKKASSKLLSDLIGLLRNNENMENQERIAKLELMLSRLERNDEEE